MMKIRKTLLGAMLMTLVLFLNILPRAYAEAGNVGRLTMSADATAVSHGDTVTVTIAPDVPVVARGAGMTVAYDPAALEPILENSRTAAPFTLSGPMKVGGKTVLRISFFPEPESHTLNREEPLAVLAFRTRIPGENIAVEMTAAYFYDDALCNIGLAKPEPVLLQVDPVPVSGIVLNQTFRNMEIGTTARLTAKVMPENATDQTITWTSSHPEIVRVENGLLTALAETQADAPVTITASCAGCTAQCTVTTCYPPDVGYVVSVPEQRSCLVGEIVQIPLAVTSVLKPDDSGALQVDRFNAFDITLSYDLSRLRLKSVDLPKNEGSTEPVTTNLTVTEVDGGVQLLGYGDTRTLSPKEETTAVILTFEALKAGSTDVVIGENARVDNSVNAVISNTSKAARKIGGELTQVVVNGYTVTLPWADFAGETVADPENPYVFRHKDPDTHFYDYTFSGTMGGEPLAEEQITRNADGSFRIYPVTGHLVIAYESRIGKQYTVTLVNDPNSDGPVFTGGATARFMEDYSFSYNEEDGQYIPLIRINGSIYPNPEPQNGRYTIPGEDIRGDIVIELSQYIPPEQPPVNPDTPGTGTKVPVSFSGAGAADVIADSFEAIKGGSYTFRVKKAEGFLYGVTYQTGAKDPVKLRPIREEPGGNTVYKIDKVTAATTVTVSREAAPAENPDWYPEPTVYLSLTDKNIYLVPVDIPLDDSYRYTYDGEPMIYSDVYDCWCILTVEKNLSPALAKEKLQVEKGVTNVMRTVDHDVNGSDRVDINDAQLVYNMYNKKYDGFGSVSMQSFLNADVNKDGTITVQDAAGVVNEIE